MKAEVATGLFTLGGVLIGVFGSGVIQAILDIRREAGEARRARRIILAELHQLEDTVVAAAGQASRPRVDRPQDFLPTSAWLSYRARLADEVDDATWGGLTSIYTQVNLLQLVFSSPDAPLDGDTRGTMVSLGKQLRAVRRRLGAAIPEHR